MFVIKDERFSIESLAADFPFLIYMLYSQTIMKAIFR